MESWKNYELRVYMIFPDDYMMGRVLEVLHEKKKEQRHNNTKRKKQKTAKMGHGILFCQRETDDGFFDHDSFDHPAGDNYI